MTPNETQELREIVARFKEAADRKLADLEKFKENRDADFWIEYRIAERMAGLLHHVEDLNVISRRLNDMSGIENPEQAD